MNPKPPIDWVTDSPDIERCGMGRRDFLRLAALATATGFASPFLSAGEQRARQFKGDDVPVKLGYLPITDATPLLVAHQLKLFEEQGLRTEQPRMFRSWAQLVEAFVAGQVNVIHLLTPATLWVRYGARFPAKIVAWNHMGGSGLTVGNDINSVGDLAGKTVAIPFWYSIHNILLQKLLRDEGLVPVSRRQGERLANNEVNLVVQPPAEMISALASGSIAGFIVAEPFNSSAELKNVGKVLRFSGDIWKDHACCVTFMAERDITERPEWAQRATNAIVNAQKWSLQFTSETAALLAASGEGRYTPHSVEPLDRVLSSKDFGKYVEQGIIRHPSWNQKRIDFQPYPYASYTEELVRSLVTTELEGNNRFLAELKPEFVARDLVDERFVRQAIELAGGPQVFGIDPSFSRRETIIV
jgi:NitT/TauT family transport system substrate-binding protein